MMKTNVNWMAIAFKFLSAMLVIFQFTLYLWIIVNFGGLTGHQLVISEVAIVSSFAKSLFILLVHNTLINQCCTEIFCSCELCNGEMQNGQNMLL
jgi:hypothetical protein